MCPRGARTEFGYEIRIKGAPVAMAAMQAAGPDAHLCRREEIAPQGPGVRGAPWERSPPEPPRPRSGEGAERAEGGRG